MNAKLIFVHALSPLHAGTGQGVGVIDLPVAREKATGVPYLPGSSLKGTLRDLCQHSKKIAVFGPESDKAEEHAGSAQFSDQRLLLLPVRSLKGTFAWVTSPYLLQRFVRDAEQTGEEASSFPKIPEPADEGCAVDPASKLIHELKKDGKDVSQVILEDLDLAADKKPEVGKWAEWFGNKVFPGDATWQGYLKDRLCVVSDDALNFLLDTATEITARIKLLEDKKTVQKGGLWYEEALPAETILSGLLVATKVQAGEQEVFDVVKETIDQAQVAQLGGKATVGRGLCRVRLA